MTGVERRAVEVVKLGVCSTTIIDLRHGGSVTIRPGEVLEGVANEYGNVYVGGRYVGSIPFDFEEVTS